MSDAVGPSGASFWRQDVNWYVQQQSWTRSFYAADQSWTRRLEASNVASPPTDRTGAPNVADQKFANLLDPQTEQGLATSQQSTSITGASGQVTSGYLLNLLA
jgi:hypothetical protein